MSESSEIVIRIRRRPWYEWLLWLLWLLVEIFFLQNAIASSGELEPRAATLFWIIFAVLLLGGVVVWFVRRGK